MKLTEKSLGSYLDAVASSEPVPGGGSAAAVCGAQGAALVAMVAALTLGRPKYAAHEDANREARERANALRAAFEAQADADAAAYARVADAFRLPRRTDEETALRSRAIAEATREATREPFRTLTLAAEALAVAESLAGRSNPNAASDLGTAAACFLACARGAWLNVRINLPGLADPGEREIFASGSDRLLAACGDAADRLHGRVAEAIG